jgi:thiol-disulfide isomerase/thioredoxin
MTVRMMKIKLMVGVIILVFLFSSFSGCTNNDNNEKPVMNFSFTTLDGQQKYLSDYRGNIIVLDLMAVNCQPCMFEMAELKRISTNYSNKNVTVISIDVWIRTGETVELLQSYIEAFHQQINVSLDWTFGVDDAQGSIEKLYANQGVPTLYILNQKGNVYYSHFGYDSYSTLKTKIDEVLNLGE